MMAVDRVDIITGDEADHNERRCGVVTVIVEMQVVARSDRSTTNLKPLSPVRLQIITAVMGGSSLRNILVVITCTMTWFYCCWYNCVSNNHYWS